MLAMESDSSKGSRPQRPHHRRHPSSKSGILQALIPSKSQGAPPISHSSSAIPDVKSSKAPLLPPDHPDTAKSPPLGERKFNVQSQPSSPSKTRQKTLTMSKTSYDIKAGRASKKSRDETAGLNKSKSSTNLGAMFAKINRSSKDLSQQVQRDKENTTPPTSSHGQPETPIWAQFATTAHLSDRNRISSDSIEDQIAKDRPQQYSPPKQRSSNVVSENGYTRPTLARRLQSTKIGHELGIGRKSEDIERKPRAEMAPAESSKWAQANAVERKTSGSSVEEAPAKEKLTIAKRGFKVMAAVAALQGKSKDDPVKEEAVLDSKAVDEAFEAVLESRNIPEPMRQKMRSLTLTVKADFVKQDQAESRMPGVENSIRTGSQASAKSQAMSTIEVKEADEESKATKKSRTRSRTFTFSKGDRRGGDASPSKKQRSQSRSRPVSVTQLPGANGELSATLTESTGTTGKKSRTAAIPADFIAYLRKNQDPCLIEVGRVHKLRILLRNETVAWVDSFISLGGMSEIVGLLHRTMDVEWREDHEDQLLHETLLCLKGLCTTERAMDELDKVADQLFPALMSMLYDDEKKGPAEYSTRTIITTVLFNSLQSATKSTPETLEKQARRILTYLGEPSKPDDARPVDFVLDMHVPRPYKLWCREVTNVTREVFWIFLHHLNVIPQPKGGAANAPPAPATDSDNNSNALGSTYTHRHFPGIRPPVPAAPYIGGVEWDATSYITSHLDLANGLIASLSTAAARNALRSSLRDSGWEKTLGATLRTCKEKFYSGVHDGLRVWVAAAVEDGWDTRFVREGPSLEEQAARARSASPKKSPAKKDKPPQLEVPKVEAPKLDFNVTQDVTGNAGGNDDDGGWLG